MINGTSTHRLRLALAALASAAVLLLDLNLDLGRIAISGGIEQRALSALEDTPFGGGPSPERELLTMPRPLRMLAGELEDGIRSPPLADQFIRSG